jgi:7,8-dihydropterin-6-yl-methyl-4-(beta-D-ribofuranosyl)aminobenzene 5'-phosphate synthase
MKLWVLTENTAKDGFSAEHGLSLYIETNGLRILFDAGQSAVFAENARKLGVDLRCVDIAILSHGHYDHGGGLAHFLQLNTTAPVYLSRHAFEPHHNAQGKDIGLNPALLDCDRLAFVDNQTTLAPGLQLLSCNQMDRPFSTDPFNLTACGAPEDFRHELYLMIEENSKRILFSGCSHKGILNIAEWFSPDVLVGGFHFNKIPPQDPRLVVAAEELSKHPTVYYTGHCTGQAQFDAMKLVLGHRLHAIHTGDFLQF